MILAALFAVGPAGASEGGQVDGDEPVIRQSSSDALAVTETNPQGIEGDLFEDYHYAVRLKRPSNAWRFLEREQAEGINPDAFVGLIHPAGRYVVVIGEPLADTTLDGYVDLCLAGNSVFDPDSIQREHVRLKGYPSAVVTAKGTVAGMEFGYRLQFVKRDSFFYQILQWTYSNQFLAAERDFLAVVNGLTLVEERRPQVPETLPSPDDQGVDWKIAEGVYENASFGFRLRPAEGFRLMGHQELKSMDVYASAGVSCPSAALNQLYFVERVGHRQRAAHAEAMLAAYEFDLGLGPEDAEVSDVRVAGGDAQQYSYRNVPVSGTNFDFNQTLFHHNGATYCIRSWWPSVDAAEARQKLAESYRHFEWMDEPQRSALEAELKSWDAENAVGLDYSYRNGTFRDFEYDYTLKCPSGLWQATTGDALALENPDARVMLCNLSTGVNVLVIPEVLDVTGEEYHDLVRQDWEIEEEPIVRATAGGGLEVFVTSFRTAFDSLDYSYRLATASRGNRKAQLLVYAFESLDAQLDLALQEVIAGFELPEDPFAPIERGEGVLTDHRLGFRMTCPPGWQLGEPAPNQAEAVSSSQFMYSDHGVCIITAAYGSDPAMELGVDAALQGMQVEVDHASRTEVDSTLGGLPATQITLSGRSGADPVFVKVWRTRRGRTTYQVLLVGNVGTPVHSASQRIKRALTLIE